MTICALLGEGECRTLSVLHLPGHLFYIRVFSNTLFPGVM